MKQIYNLIFEPRGMHNPALAYSIKDAVMSTDGRRVYFALQDVPAGTPITDASCWKLMIDLSGVSGGNINLQSNKTVTPSASAQTVRPDSGYNGLSQVTVNPIPERYADTSDANAVAAQILNGGSAYVNGKKVIGSMPDNGRISFSFDGLDVTGVDIPQGYTDGGRVGLTDDIDNGLTVQGELMNQIIAALDGKGIPDGGANVQVKTGTVTTSGVAGTRIPVDCGFMPDVLIFSVPDKYTEGGKEYINNICFNMAAAAIDESMMGVTFIGEIGSSTFRFTAMYAYKKSTGFELSTVYEATMNGSMVNPAKTYGYTAIKYTA